MDQPRSSRQYLEAALESLVAERAALTSALDALNTQIREVTRFLEIGPAVMVSPMPAADSSGSVPLDEKEAVTSEEHVPPVRQVVEEVASSGDVFTFDDVMRRLAEVGNDAQTASVSSIISRHPKIGRGPKRGTYQLVRPDPDHDERTLGADPGLRQNAGSITSSNDDAGSEILDSAGGATSSGYRG